MSSIVFDFKNSQDANHLRKALEYAIDEADSTFVLDNGEKMSADWFYINSFGISIYETGMDQDDIESAHSRLCDILINMLPKADFSSHASHFQRISGYEKVFHIDYIDGKKSGFDIEGISGYCCPECDESLIDISEYDPKMNYKCDCGYEYDPLEECEWYMEVYDSMEIAEIPELKSKNIDVAPKLHVDNTQSVSIDFEGKIFVSTGLSLEDEAWAKEQIESRGGIMKHKFVVSLNYLIYNPDYDHETVKLTRAKEQIEKGKPVQIITFDEFKQSL